MATTIQIEPETRAMLAGFKQGPRDTYDAVLRRLMALIPEGDEEGRYTPEFRMGLLEGRLDILQGRTISHAEVKKRLGLR